MSKLRTLFGIGVALGSVGVAHAQQTPTPRPAPAPTPAQQNSIDSMHSNAGQFEREYDNRVRLKLHDKAPGIEEKLALGVATCLASKAGQDANAMIGGPMSGDPNYDSLVKALTSRKYNRCVGASAAGLPMNEVNGALAETLIKSNGESLPDHAIDVNAGAAQNFFTDPAGKTIDSVARCLAIYSPGLAVKVLDTEPGSTAEAGALTALYAGSPECGMPAAPDGFTPSEQRNAVAVGLYHWLHHG